MDQEEVQRLRRAIRSVQKRLRQDALDERWCGLTLRAVHVCFLIYVLASDAGVAPSYADAARRRRRKCLPPAVSAAPIFASQWFLEVPLETLEELMSPTCARSRGIDREAQIYMAEHRTAVWVFGYWQWLSNVEHVARQRDRRPVFVNLDETSIPLHLPLNRGLVCKRAAKLGLCQQRPCKRGAVTLCAAITDASDIQPYLPQLVLSARAIFSRGFVRAAQDRVSPRLLLKPCRSGWMTQASFCDYVEDIAAALDMFDGVQGILVFDCCPAHLVGSAVANPFRAQFAGCLCADWNNRTPATIRCRCVQTAEEFFEETSLSENG
eukprot:Skav206964  [mRNA]  locus=scaffold255:323968:325547:+ [translate_table: standard]